MLGTLSETVNIAALQQENAQLNATVASLTSELDSFKQQLDSHKQQLDWFQRQLFGRKSEKRLEFDAREQGNLLFGLGVEAPPEQDDIPTEKITYQRRKKQRAASVNDSGLRFDASVPVLRFMSRHYPRFMSRTRRLRRSRKRSGKSLPRK